MVTAPWCETTEGVGYPSLQWSFAHAKVLLGTLQLAVVLATVSVAFFPRAFLPAFTTYFDAELGTNPGTSLKNHRIVLGWMAEQLIMQCPKRRKSGAVIGR